MATRKVTSGLVSATYAHGLSNAESVVVRDSLMALGPGPFGRMLRGVRSRRNARGRRNQPEAGQLEKRTGSQRERTSQNVGDRERGIRNRGLRFVGCADDGPIRGAAEQKLNAEECVEQFRRAAQVADFAETLFGDCARPDDEQRDDACADEMRHNAKRAV